MSEEENNQNNEGNMQDFMRTQQQQQVQGDDLLRVTMSFSRSWVDNKCKPEHPIYLVRHGLITKLNNMIQIYPDQKSQEVKKIANTLDEEGVPCLHYATFYNYQNLVMYLLVKGAEPFQISKKDERTLFHVACFMGHIQTLKIVLNYRRHVKRMELYRQTQEIMKLQGFKKTDVKNGILVSPDRHIKQVKDRFVIFQKSIEELAKRAFSELYDDYKNIVDRLDQNNRNVFHYTSMNKTAKSVLAAEILLNYDLKLEGFDEFLELFQEVQLLELNKELKIDPRQYLHAFEILQNFLLPASYDGIYQKFKKDLREIKQKSVLEQDQDGYTPMHLAAFNGSFAGIQLLIKHCGNKQSALEIKDTKSKRTVLDYAENDQVRKYLVDLQDAARKGDQDSMKLLVNCGHNLNQRKTVFGVAPIHNTLLEKTASTPFILDYIIKCDANIDVADSNGWTGLHHACRTGDIKSIQTLLNQGASLNKASNKGYFPIHIASLYDNFEVIEFLLSSQNEQFRASSEVIDNDKCTPLLLASKKGYTNSIKKLLDSKANLYAQDLHGWTALHHAAFNYHSDAIRLLCEYDADDEKLRYIPNKKGQYAKQLANKPGKTDVLFSMNTIWYAAREGLLDIVRKLHQKGEKLDKQTIKKKLTPLHLAVMGNKQEHYLVVKYLVDNGADVNANAQSWLGVMSQEEREALDSNIECWESPIGYAYELQNMKVFQLLTQNQ